MIFTLKFLIRNQWEKTKKNKKDLQKKIRDACPTENSYVDPYIGP